jgi:hypothetical protein
MMKPVWFAGPTIRWALQCWNSGGGEIINRYPCTKHVCSMWRSVINPPFWWDQAQDCHFVLTVLSLKSSFFCTLSYSDGQLYRTDWYIYMSFKLIREIIFQLPNATDYNIIGSNSSHLIPSNANMPRDLEDSKCVSLMTWVKSVSDCKHQRSVYAGFLKGMDNT